MKISAIISEYNPFHNGHKYQIDTAKEITGCDAVIALMSGNIVQRADFSIFDKSIRASAALNGGIDLVLENPALSVLQSAEGYAYSAVATLTKLNCVDFLVFGAECSSLDDLNKIAQLLATEDNEFKNTLSQELSKGNTFASARGKTVAHFLGKDAENILKQPNNLLAIEYLKAIIRQDSSLKPILIKRTGADHNSMHSNNGFASATLIRENLLNKRSIANFVPRPAIYENQLPFDIKFVEKAIISSVLLLSKEKLAQCPDVAEGLENKIKDVVYKTDTLEELFTLIKSKRYTHSRLRRIILSAYLGITKDDIVKEPCYIKILDFNENGQKVLNYAKKTTLLPLCKNATPLLKNAYAMNIWKKELAFDKVYEIFSK